MYGTVHITCPECGWRLHASLDEGTAIRERKEAGET